MITEIISYMSHELVNNDTFDRIFNDRFNCHNTRHDVASGEEKYFNLRIKNKTYPSCYQYNVLVMLAKRLIEEDKKLAVGKN